MNVKLSLSENKPRFPFTEIFKIKLKELFKLPGLFRQSSERWHQFMLKSLLNQRNNSIPDKITVIVIGTITGIRSVGNPLFQQIGRNIRLMKQKHGTDDFAVKSPDTP